MEALCAACGQPTTDDALRCAQCGGETRLKGRYLLRAIVGQGAMGVTYRASDEAGGADLVAIKEIPLRHTDPELARRVSREASVLGQLHHDRIPAYVEDFTVGVGKQQVFYLVQAYIEGPTLADEMTRRRYTEDEVLAILDDLADILAYLHRLMPPVVHRDLKLKNVIRRARDQKLVLIDFGAVRDVVADPRVGGSTVAGTYGYMAPEQFRGEASPQSDLYALGVLGVVLLTRKDPVELARPDHSLDWRAHVTASAPTQRLLEALLQPEASRRPASAEDVRQQIARIRRAEPEARALVEARSEVRIGPTVRVQIAPPALRQRLDARSFRLAIFLAFVGSPIGFHWWYLGRPAFGILSAIFCLTGIPLFGALVHGVLMWTRGRRAFDERYNPEIVALEDGRAARLAQEIDALHDLHLKGALTAEEFEREKRRLLGHHPPALSSLLNGLEQGGLFGALHELRKLPQLIHDEVTQELRDRHRRERRRRK